MPTALRVDVEPLGPDDWEVQDPTKPRTVSPNPNRVPKYCATKPHTLPQVLELHAGYVEEQLLNQARVVTADRVLPVWIMQSSLIRFKAC